MMKATYKSSLIVLSILLLTHGWMISHGKSSSECVLNDDFCDCGDDESETSACSINTVSELTFKCKDTEYITMSLASSRIHDGNIVFSIPKFSLLSSSSYTSFASLSKGVCDCCDGSDEKESKNCQNVCAAVHAAEIAKRDELIRIRSEGLIKKYDMVADGNEKLRIVKNTSATLTSSIKEREDNINRYRIEKVVMLKETQESKDAAVRSFRDKVIKCFVLYIPQDPLFVLTMKVSQLQR